MVQPQERIFVFVKRRLDESKGRWPDVAKGAGIPISTVRKIARGQIADPAVSKVQELADYFVRLDAFSAVGHAPSPEVYPVSETGTAEQPLTDSAVVDDVQVPSGGQHD